jgi:hypothetical protein
LKRRGETTQREFRADSAAYVAAHGHSAEPELRAQLGGYATRITFRGTCDISELGGIDAEITMRMSLGHERMVTARLRSVGDHLSRKRDLSAVRSADLGVLSSGGGFTSPPHRAPHGYRTHARPQCDGCNCGGLRALTVLRAFSVFRRAAQSFEHGSVRSRWKRQRASAHELEHFIRFLSLRFIPRVACGLQNQRDSECEASVGQSVFVVKGPSGEVVSRSLFPARELL